MHINSSGSVCLDVINQTWSPMFELINIFEVFLPQLLLYPNDADPLNNNAASLRMKDIKKFEIMVIGIRNLFIILGARLCQEICQRSYTITP